MSQATTASTAASAASGTKPASGAATSTKTSRKSECAMPATGPCAPARTLVAVRAMVPVTQKPPKSAEPTLAMPCATSSMFERCRRPVMPSATTAESSDSIAPSSAKLKASGSTAITSADARPAAAPAAGSPAGCRRRRVLDGRDRQTERPAATAASATTISIRGQCGRSRFSATSAAKQPSDSASVGRVQRSAAPPRAPAASRSSGPGSGPASVRPEQRHDLAGEDDRGDAGGEADGHRIGDELEKVPSRSSAGQQQDHAREHGREDQPVDAVRGDGRRDQHDEGAGRPADLEAAAAQRRDQEAADDRGIEPALRRHAGGDGDRHGQRQRDDRHRQPGEQVGPELGGP